MKNNTDALFFTPDVCAAGRHKHPVSLHRFRLRENGEGCRFGELIVGDAFALTCSGMLRRVNYKHEHRKETVKYDDEQGRTDRVL